MRAMMKKIWTLTGCCLLACITNAQRTDSTTYSKEFSFITENDAFLLNKADAYYTNGFFLRQTKAEEKGRDKRITSFELGQMIYTPLIRKTQNKSDVDRPYCGYLYAKVSQSTFAQNNSIVQYGASLGMIGAKSYGEDVQNWYHNLLGYGKFTGWQYQVQNSLGIDLSMSYGRTVFQDSSWIKLVPVAEGQLGSTFTNAKLGMYTCLGWFADNAHSVLWNARVQRKGELGIQKPEFFLYWYPQVILQGYNATVEGGLFNTGDGSAALGTTRRWMFQQAWGMCFAQERWTIKLAIIYQTLEAVAQTKPQRYGSILVGYRIH